MTKLQLKNHPVWQDLTEVLANLDANALVDLGLAKNRYRQILESINIV